jgi:hypothetical protein
MARPKPINMPPREVTVFADVTTADAANVQHDLMALAGRKGSKLHFLLVDMDKGFCMALTPLEARRLRNAIDILIGGEV